jgi:uncharacterized protein YyaL (SSP411 family)
VDRYWHVPHFEKMLYDQAQLVVSLVEAYQVSGDPDLAMKVRETCDYVLRDLGAPGGGIFSAEDADSEGKEGTFYLWTKAEIDQLLGDASAAFCAYYAIEPDGNADDPHGELTGKNVLHAVTTEEDVAQKLGKSPAAIQMLLAGAREKLFEARAKRPRPLRDEKILASWNGMMIGALARAHQVFGEPRWLDGARRAAAFIRDKMWDGQILRRRWADGETAGEGYLDDYANYASGLLDLYEADFDLGWLELAEAVAGRMVRLFHDEVDGGFFSSTGTDPTILLRTKDDYDGAEPAGNTIAARTLLRLASVLDRPEWQRIAEGTIRCFSARLKETPWAMPAMLSVAELVWEPGPQVVVAASAADAAPFWKAVHARYSPKKSLLLADEAARERLGKRLPWFAAMGPVDGKPAAYLCKDHVCDRPVTDPEALRRALPTRSF